MVERLETKVSNLRTLLETRILSLGYENRLKYLEQAKVKGIIKNEDAARNWIRGARPFPLYNLRLITQDLGISLEELVKVFGSNPFKPNVEDFKRDANPLGRLIDFYIDLRTGKSRRMYLSEAKERGIIESEKAADIWFYGKSPFPLGALRYIVEDLDIPTEEIVAVCGKDPLKPDIGMIKQNPNPLGILIDHYIELRTGVSGKPKANYLRGAEKRGLIKNAAVAQSWSTESHHPPLRYAKALVEDLNIPLDELIAVYGKDPFKPDLEKIKQSKNPLGELLDFYIELKIGKTRKSRDAYLKEAKRNGIIETVAGASPWFTGNNEFPIFKLRKFIDDLNIPLEEIVKVHGRNPFVLSNEDLDRFNQSGYGLRNVIDWYIELRVGEPRYKYLNEAQKKGIVENVHTAAACITGTSRFPPDKLKLIVDDLQIPYSEVNQFIEYDIAQANQVATLRSNSATPQQSIQSTIQTLNIPTDPQSLSQIVSLFSDDEIAGTRDFVDFLYSSRPHEMLALERRKIGRQEVSNFLGPYIRSDSGTSSTTRGNGNFPPILTLSYIVPFETYQREATIRSRLIDISLTSHLSMPYETAVQSINAQLAANPDNQVLQHVLIETKDYLERINALPKSITRVGA